MRIATVTISITFANIVVFTLFFFFSEIVQQLQQYKSGAIQISSQNDGSKENHDGEKVSVQKEMKILWINIPIFDVM